MSDIAPVIQFNNVSKRFSYQTDTPQTVLEKIISFLPRRGKNRTHNKDLWALKDVNFQVMPGQTVGIIGRNGSGKSTALKLMTRILRPSNGRILVRGRVSALLELGAGFHEDLSGRDNIYLNGAILGLDKELITAQYNKIVEFSELGDFINMPVKHYSSGMYMRLGFSVAIHMNPDVLIVDEILAVGDQAFQTKCLDRIHSMKQDGITIVIVTHDLHIVRQLCTHLIWLEQGDIRAVGPTNEVANLYEASSQEASSRQLVTEAGSFSRHGSQEIEITAVRFLDADNKEAQVFKTGDAMTIEMVYMAHEAIPAPEFGFAIYRHDGVHINGPNTKLANASIGLVEGQGIVQYQIASLPLLPARYEVTAAIYDGRYPKAYDHHKQAYSFRVTPGGNKELYGLLEIPANWQWIPSKSPDNL